MICSAKLGCLRESGNGPGFVELSAVNFRVPSLNWHDKLRQALFNMISKKALWHIQ